MSHTSHANIQGCHEQVWQDLFSAQALTRLQKKLPHKYAKKLCSVSTRGAKVHARLPEQVQRERALYRHARHHHHNPLESVAAYSDAHRLRASRTPLHGSYA